ncbi:hypothetical protein A2U01_0110794, partial [Trifolium medium]|nr:hypothetical protein [Trifolium medium]
MIFALSCVALLLPFARCAAQRSEVLTFRGSEVQ